MPLKLSLHWIISLVIVHEVYSLDAGSTRVSRPLVNLHPRPGALTVQMLDSDSDLRDEYGDHLMFQIFYSREGEGLVKYPKPSRTTEAIENLPSRERYCVEVEYVLYGKPHGPRSSLECVLIPESDSERYKRHTLIVVPILSLLTASTLLALYAFNKKGHRIKLLLNTPRMPDHLEEFFSGDFSRPSPASPSTETSEVISTVTVLSEWEELEMEKELNS